jgi:hypothetical protein
MMGFMEMGSYVSEDGVYEIGVCWVLPAITVRHFRGIVHVIFLLIEPLVGAFSDCAVIFTFRYS